MMVPTYTRRGWATGPPSTRQKCPESGTCILRDSLSAVKALEKAIECGETGSINVKKLIVATGRGSG